MNQSQDPKINATDGRHTNTNRLAGETSPYLLQHANNPVDWYPWGDEALDRATAENKPIFLSIGYSACHWCHVMERESFENPGVARYMNDNFVCIKVDREERPDIDEIYMKAVQMMTGSGGWPLSVFLTPDLKPFFGGTYFPPEDSFGRPGFRKLLEHISDAWGEKQQDILNSAEELTRTIRRTVDAAPGVSGPLDVSLLSRAVDQLERTFDPVWAGFGRAPKFPPGGAIAFLLRQYQRTGDEKLLNMATRTLDQMAYGGMYDHLGGGFHRYSTDERWLVPHFEKMLYDNAILARVYLEAWQLTQSEFYRRVATEILDNVLNDLTDRRGGFISALDADSEGEEGKFYVWRHDEIKKILGDDEGDLFCEYYGVDETGNFEGTNILHVAGEPAEFAAKKGLTADRLAERLGPARDMLLEVRNRRAWPAKDDKVLASWNGLMISALAHGYQTLHEERFLEAARKAADFVLTSMVRDGALLHTYSSRGGDNGNGVAKLPAYLDDYAEVANGLIDLYEATFEWRWLEAAGQLADKMITEFHDTEHEGFFFTSESHKNLLVRIKPFYDGPVPSGNATATGVLLRLSKFFDNAAYFKIAEGVLASSREMVFTQPAAYMDLIRALDFYLHPVLEIGIAGRLDNDGTRRLLEIVHSRFIPNKILALVDAGADTSGSIAERIPLLSGKKMISGASTVYVCENYACKNPVTDALSLERLLDAADVVPATPGKPSAENTSGQ